MTINPNFKKVAILAAREAGKQLKKNFGKVKKVSFKKDLSFVTNVDFKGRIKGDFLRLSDIWRRVGRICRRFRFFGSMSLELCYIASGRLDATIIINGKLWDLAPGVLMIKEAGEKVTDFKGKHW